MAERHPWRMGTIPWNRMAKEESDYAMPNSAEIYGENFARMATGALQARKDTVFNNYQKDAGGTGKRGVC